jgi:prefoldin subunit 5
MSNPPRAPSTSRMSTAPSQKPRQISHLQSQLAQLTANMADLESLMRMTAQQAQEMRSLGGYSGAMSVYPIG